MAPTTSSLRTFQSAPLTKARGDLRAQIGFQVVLRFNPLPSQKQGETRRLARPCIARQVSIRSPHKSKGRRGPSAVCHVGRWFQSAPLTKARGDIPQAITRKRRQGFNPLPSQKQGETLQQYPRAASLNVSIRSPHKSKGRQMALYGCYPRSRFQSAPLTKARGDTQTCPSLHSPSGFNPLPSQKQGETRPKCCLPRGKMVSIRSPHKSKGRHSPSHHSQTPTGFQSAPLTKARGDAPAISSGGFP